MDGSAPSTARRMRAAEWSGQGMFPFDASNEAYKLGVNYVIHGMTH